MLAKLLNLIGWNNQKNYRAKWASQLVIPKCPMMLYKLVDHPPVFIGHKLEQYLTHTEIERLLLKYGWLESTVLNGKVKYYTVPEEVISMKLDEYISNNPHLLPGEEYMLFKVGV